MLYFELKLYTSNTGMSSRMLWRPASKSADSKLVKQWAADKTNVDDKIDPPHTFEY